MAWLERSRARSVGLALACCAFLSLAACRPSDAPSGAETVATGAPLTIGYSRLRISVPIFVAKEYGLFAKHGIDAKLVMYDTAQPLMQALVEGRTSVAGYTALPITYNAMIRSGVKLLFLTALVEDQKHRISYLLRRKPVPAAVPAIRTIGDLKGKAIGILPTIAYKAWLEAILGRHGIQPNEVSIRPIEPQLQGQALASGAVDALFTNDPAATGAIAAGIAELVTGDVETPKVFGEPFLFGSFNARKDWADAHPELLDKLSAALDEAVELVIREPAKAKLAMRPYLPEAFQAQVELYPDAWFLPSDRVRPSDFTRLAAEYRSMGIIEQPLDLGGLVVSRPLAER